MFFAEVTFLMRNGRRLTKSERAPPGRYMVTNLECDRDKNNFRRNVVQASLYVSYGTAQMAGRGSLFDPVLLPFNGPGFLWSGIELESGDGEMGEHRQVWHIVPVERSGVE